MLWDINFKNFQHGQRLGISEVRGPTHAGKKKEGKADLHIVEYFLAPKNITFVRGLTIYLKGQSNSVIKIRYGAKAMLNIRLSIVCTLCVYIQYIH